MSDKLEMASEVAKIFKDYGVSFDEAVEIVKKIYGADYSGEYLF